MINGNASKFRNMLWNIRAKHLPMFAKLSLVQFLLHC